MLVIKQGIERLDHLEVSYSPALLYIGAKHRDKQKFCVDNFGLFRDSILFIWKQVLRDKWTTQAQQAWETLLDYIIAGFKAGFHNS